MILIYNDTRAYLPLGLLSKELSTSQLVSLGFQDSMPVIRLRWGKFSVKYWTVLWVNWRYLWVLSEEKPSCGKQETWNSSKWETDFGHKICLIRSSVQRGRSRRPILVTYKNINNNMQIHYKTLFKIVLAIFSVKIHFSFKNIHQMFTLKRFRLEDLERKWLRFVKLIRDSFRCFKFSKGTVFP